MELTFRKIEIVNSILLAIGRKRHPELAMAVYYLSCDIKEHVGAVEAARRPHDKILEYSKKQDRLGAQFSKKDEHDRPMKQRLPDGAGGWVNQWTITDARGYMEASAALEEEYQEALEAEEKRLESLEQLLDRTVELEFQTKIKYSWCKELLAGNDLTVLLPLGILEVDETPGSDGVDEPEDSSKVEEA